jgi:hypothetical protein
MAVYTIIPANSAGNGAAVTVQIATTQAKVTGCALAGYSVGIFKANMDIGGFDIQCFTDGSPPSKCQALCLANASCKGWNNVHTGSAWGNQSGCCYKTNNAVVPAKGIDFWIRGTGSSATQGVAVTATAPTGCTNSPTSFSIWPPLPAGLVFNVNTGGVSGTPTAFSYNAVTYTITPANDFGNGVPFTTVIDVLPALVTGCAYPSSSSVSLGVATAMTPLVPQSCSSTPSSFVSLSLPAGTISSLNELLFSLLS